MGVSLNTELRLYGIVVNVGLPNLYSLRLVDSLVRWFCTGAGGGGGGGGGGDN